MTTLPHPNELLTEINEPTEKQLAYLITLGMSATNVEEIKKLHRRFVSAFIDYATSKLSLDEEKRRNIEWDEFWAEHYSGHERQLRRGDDIRKRKTVKRGVVVGRCGSGTHTVIKWNNGSSSFELADDLALEPR